MSAQDKLDRSAEKHGLGSDKRIRRIKKAKDFFSKPVPTYSKDELRKMGHPVEQNEGRFDITFPEPTAKNTARKNPAASARNKANSEKNKDKIQKAMAKDKARSASGSLTRTDDHRRKNYQTGKSGAHFSKYESSAEYGKSMDRIRDKEKNAAIKPKDRDTLGKIADLMKKQKRNEAYRKPTQAEIDADKKKDGKGKDSSTRYRDMKKKVYGNAMGGLKDAAGQEFTAVPTKTGDASKADRLSIAKMDAIMKKRSKDKRQKESVNLEENKIFFVKVGTGRDHMTVKVKAPNSREALKKMRAQHPKDKVALDQNQKQGRSAGALESVEMNEDTAIAHQTPYGTVTAYKRDTKGMRGKQDGFKLTLKTKSGKTVDLGSHPKPTKANVLTVNRQECNAERVSRSRRNERVIVTTASTKDHR